jgi:hypothetical protein
MSAMERAWRSAGINVEEVPAPDTGSELLVWDSETRQTIFVIEQCQCGHSFIDHDSVSGCLVLVGTQFCLCEKA